jgi:glycosyltransferase involved in cell wall biosynthesis
MTRSIALVLDYDPEYLGGAQTAYVEQIALLAGAGHRVAAVAPASRDLSRRCAEVGAEHIVVAARVVLPGIRLPWLRNTTALRRRLRAEFAQRSVDVVHVHSELGLSAAATCAARGLGLPVVHTVHTAFWRGPERAPRVVAALIRSTHRWLTGLRWSSSPHGGSAADDALRGMTTAAAACADVVVSPSAHQAEVLRARLLRPCVVTVPNTARAVRRAALPPVRPLRILWAARCEPEKRLLEFLEAVRLAQLRLGPGRLLVTVVGDGSTLDEATRLGVHDVRFLGRVPHDRMPALLARHHLLAVTSHGFDNQPMTIVEALAAGRGVLVCDPALSEGLALAGRFCGPAPHEMAAEIVDLVGDPEAVGELAEHAAAERAFDAEGVLRRLECVYRLADRARPRRPSARVRGHASD